MAEDRRHGIRPFSPNLIRSFLGNRHIVSSERLTTGKSNSNYKLQLSDGQTVVARLYSNGTADRETYVMDLARHLVPVPRELARGDGWAIFSFLDGHLLADAPQQVGAAANALARIALVQLDAPGWINPDGSISPFSFGGGRGYIDESLEKPEVRAWLGAEAIAALRAVVAQNAGRFAEMDAQRRLVHGDFNPTNILMRDGAVSGVLDWEFSHAGTPYMDVGNLLRHADAVYHDAIKRGLEAGGMALPDDWRERAELVDLTSQLEFLTSGRSARFKRQCVARIERTVARFRS